MPAWVKLLGHSKERGAGSERGAVTLFFVFLKLVGREEHPVAFYVFVVSSSA